VKVREHLTYANVAATLALVGVVGGGGAYAAGVIDSGDIENNSVASRDLENRQGVAGRDVKRNSLTGRELRERTLDASTFAPLDSRFGDECDPGVGGGFFPCVTRSLRLPAQGRTLLVATGEVATGGLECRIAVDGELTGAISTPGDEGESFTITTVTRRLPKGSHNFSLRCDETEDDGRLERASIAVLGISG
jgi:hypothetical protein